MKSMKSLNVAVVGATGMVGRTMLKALEQREFPVGSSFLLHLKNQWDLL